jgi:glyoxylase-like metal-dependent hydrolase (beta-lactamase superfamily II)
MTWAVDGGIVLRTLMSFFATAVIFLALFLPMGSAVAVDVPKLFPGTNNPMKKWETQKLADGVYAFRYTFYRNIFIVTDRGVIVTDPLSIEAARILRGEIYKVTSKPILFVAYTHSHWDHSSGGEIFKDEGARFVAQERCAQHFVDNPNPDVMPADITYKDEYKIDLGEKSLELFYFGPSHDSCLAVMLIQPANMLFLVDIANPPDGWAMFYNPAVSEDRVWNMVQFFDRVQGLIDERNIETVIGGHMTMGVDRVTGRRAIISGLMGPATVVSERREMWHSVIDEVRRELAAGAAPADVPDRLVARQALADRISGYDPEQMRVLWHRITRYTQTGE